MEALLRKIPPADLPKTMEAAEKVVDKATMAKLEKTFPVPFTVCSFDDDDDEKAFIMCPSNNVADGEYRSPFTNNVFKKGGKKGSAKSKQTDEVLLDLEKKFNNVWEAYTKLYYGREAVGSVYLGETAARQFLGIFCIHKSCEDGLWNSYHEVQMDDPEEKTCQYHVNSTVWVVVNPDHDYKDNTTTDVSAYLTKRTSKVLKIEKFFLEEYHVQNIGSIVEANEIDIRSNLEQVYLPKTKDIMDTIQKEPEGPRQVNPLMGMIMDSSVLKKKKMGGVTMPGM
eukprot:CAMPEP_0198143890 /NCGR_PEP_ID=MMETSP1443-20131203/11416_1 /TAXON_ID=186043 /ORGANISM="Entomoneis sp., Strain CCMP2396" /LENGTH=281 /DNA_ID=CAMNT_0043807193 /DNA_START=197 /DNA_END=1042 /DNA_ORIENTATION=-